MRILVSLFLSVFSGLIFAEVPQEIQGTWTPDIERSVSLMEKNIPETNGAYMRENYLPKLERTITTSQYVHRAGKRELKAEISLKQKQGSSYVMVLSNETFQAMEVMFITQKSGGYVMQSQNPADGSGYIIWKKDSSRY